MDIAKAVRGLLTGLGVAGLASTKNVASKPLTKHFKLSADQIHDLAKDHGGAIASDRITVDGLPVRFMYREAANNEYDSGWRFLTGTEDDAYMADAGKHNVYDVNTVANYDSSIIPYLDAPIGTAYEKLPDAQDFVRVEDWTSPTG